MVNDEYIFGFLLLSLNVNESQWQRAIEHQLSNLTSTHGGEQVLYSFDKQCWVRKWLQMREESLSNWLLNLRAKI